MAKDNANIIHFPDFVKLKEEVEKLQTEMSMLISEKSELVLMECKNIEAAYMLEVGYLEYQAYELHCTVLRLKRKIEIIQAKKNRQEKIFPDKIEEQLDIEFKEYKERLNEQLGKLNEALERAERDILTKESFQELKKLYRAIVKKLHPDLHPNMSEEQKNMFLNAVRAYDNGDLKMMRFIHGIVEGMEVYDFDKSGMDALQEEKERLTEMLVLARNEINEIKSQYPYILKELLEDEDKIAAQKISLEKDIEELKDAVETYQSKLEEMLR